MFSKILQVKTFSPFTRLTLNNRFFYRPKQTIIKPIGQRPEIEYMRKRSTYLNIALTCFVFAVCFAAIPAYRTFCEHMGLVGDYEKKEYNFDGLKINNLKKYRVNFSGYSDPEIDWDFEPVEKTVVISAGQTAIIFYRLYNRENKPIVGFSTYNISPEDCNAYFSKIQCFCFNQQLINPKEELLLPIFFYLEPEINQDLSTSRINDISVTYNFLRSAKQDLAKFAKEELQRVQQNKKKLNEIRAKKMNMTVLEYINHLEEQQAKEQEEQQKLDIQKQFKKKSEQEMEARLKKNFQEEMLKAEMISQQFTNDNLYDSNKRKAASIA